MGLGSILELCKEKYVIGAMFMFLRKKNKSISLSPKSQRGCISKVLATAPFLQFKLKLIFAL